MMNTNYRRNHSKAGMPLLMAFICAMLSANCIGQNWLPLSSGVSGPVLSMIEYNGKLIIGGSFIQAGGIPTYNIAAWDGTAWTSLLSGVNDSTAPFQLGSVKSLCIYNNELYAAGHFTNASGTPVRNIAKWNGTSWNDVGGGVRANFSSMIPTVSSMAVFGNELFIVGTFDSAGTIAAQNIAKWDGLNWSSVGNLVPNINSFTGPTYYANVGRALYADNTNLYVGGVFDSIGNIAASNIAKWNGTNWSTMGFGLNGAVNNINEYNGSIYAGNSSTGISSWYGSTWQSVGGGLTTVALPGNALTSAAVDNKLVVGGLFSNSGLVQNTFYISFWNDSIWGHVTPSVTGSGFDASVYSVCSYNGVLYAGGDFIQEFNQTILLNRIARYSGPVNVHELESFNHIKLFPNPFTENLNVEGLAPSATITLFDMQGRIVSKFSPKKSIAEINGEHLANGAYILCYEHDEMAVRFFVLKQ